MLFRFLITGAQATNLNNSLFKNIILFNKKSLHTFTNNTHIRLNKFQQNSPNLNLIFRRNRVFGKKGGKNANNEEIKKVKVNPAGIRRLLSLAKPEKYKIFNKEHSWWHFYLTSLRHQCLVPIFIVS